MRVAVLKIDEPAAQPRFLELVEGDERFQQLYVARVGWWPDGSVMVQIEDREQRVLQLLRIDPTTGLYAFVSPEASCSNRACGLAGRAALGAAGGAVGRLDQPARLAAYLHAELPI